MTDRFSRLFELPRGLYSAGSPIIVEAGVILKDGYSGRIVTQLKFRNISKLTIKALMVGLSAYDISGKEIAGVDEYQYLDMSIKQGQAFGSDKAIVMSSDITRSIAIKGLTIIDSNGRVYKVATPMHTLPGNIHLNSILNNSDNLIEQYKLDVNEDAIYKPQEWEDMWQCSCGSWNREPTCFACKAHKDTVFSSFDIAKLTKRTEERLDALRIKEEERLRLNEIEQAERKKRELKEQIEREKIAAEKKARARKTLTICSAAALATALIFVLTSFIINRMIPSIKYNSAIAYLNEGDYIIAAEVFAEIGDYKDSETQLSKCNAEIRKAENAAKYSDAITLMEAGKYEEAKRAFQGISGYADSAAKALECEKILAEIEMKRMYTDATHLLDSDKYAEAAAIFSEIFEYQDSKELYKKCLYEKALNLISDGDYYDAYNTLSEIAGYKDSRALLNKFHWRVSSFYFVERMFQQKVKGEFEYKFDSNGQLENVEVVAGEYVDNYIIENNIPVSATRSTPSRSTYVEEYTYELEKDREYKISSIRADADAFVVTYDHPLYGTRTDGVYYIRDRQCFLVGYDTWISHNTDYVADKERVTEIVIKDDSNSHIYLEWSLYYDNGAIDELPYLAMYIYKVTEFLI